MHSAARARSATRDTPAKKCGPGWPVRRAWTSAGCELVLQAVEVELTPKTLARTSRIMTGLLTPPRYARVLYLTAAAAEPVVTRAAAALSRPERARLTVETLPRSALTWPA